MMFAICLYMRSSLSLGMLGSRSAMLVSFSDGSWRNTFQIPVVGDIIHYDEGTEAQRVLGGGSPVIDVRHRDRGHLLE